MAKKPTRDSQRGPANVAATPTSARSTVAGPAKAAGKAPRPGGAGALERKMSGTQALAEQARFNQHKASEYGDAARTPPPGETHQPADDLVTASTITEVTPSDKV